MAWTYQFHSTGLKRWEIHRRSNKYSDITMTTQSELSHRLNMSKKSRSSLLRETELRPWQFLLCSCQVVHTFIAFTQFFFGGRRTVVGKWKKWSDFISIGHQEIIIFIKNTCCEITDTPAFSTFYNLSFASKTALSHLLKHCIRLEMTEQGIWDLFSSQNLSRSSRVRVLV